MSTLHSPIVEEEVSQKTNLEGLYHLILHDDNDHSYDYVVEMLMEILQFDEEKAYFHTVEVDTKKRTILITTYLEIVEHRQEQIHAYGPDPLMSRSKGSMTCSIEKAF